MNIEGPIGISCADIYLRFPEIMEEEFEDLIEYIEDEHINYEGATDIVYNLQQENQQLKERIDKAIKYIKSKLFSENFEFNSNERLVRMELSSILKGDNNE